MAYSSEYINMIEEVSAHLDYRVGFADIEAWLQNFDEKDRGWALQLLDYFNLFTSDRIYASLNHSLMQINQDYGGEIRIVGARKISKIVTEGLGGQSGQMLGYYARKLADASYPHIKVINESELDSFPQNEPYTIVLLDDVAGTGDTIWDYFQFIQQKFSEKWRVAALVVAYMPDAKQRLEANHITVYGEEVLSIFHTLGKIPIAEHDNESYFRIAQEYGERLYDAKAGSITPLGYKDCQAMVGFEYGTPNNTLPIIWASKKESGKKYPWIPIFPRYIADRLDAHRKRVNGLHKWTGIVRKEGLTLNDGQTELADQIVLFLILSLKERGYDEVLITNVLCINQSTYDENMNLARDNDYIDPTNHITAKGQHTLTQIRKISNRKPYVNSSQVNTSVYLPHE